jgi:hypothetical protein
MAANAYDPNFCPLIPKKPLYEMKVMWNGVTVALDTFDPNGTAAGEALSEWNMGWVHHAVAVTGTGTDVMTFESVEPGGPCGPTLDSVSVTPSAPGPPPTVTKLSAKKGPAGGGTSVTITGTHYVGVTDVSFGGTPAASFIVNSATSLTAISPPHQTGTADVVVTTPNGKSVLSSKDRFKFGSPTVTGLSPASGGAAGGLSVTVTGTGFGPATVVKFGKVAGTSVVCSTSTTCSVLTPAGKAGMVDVTATVGKKSSKKNLADHFTYS